MTPDLETDLRALETATDFAAIRDVFARVDKLATQRGARFLAQVLPMAASYALALWAAQSQNWLPRTEWIIPVGAFFGAVLTHSLIFRAETRDFQRIGFALRKWRASARRLT
jgi:roadblock/LC7 domain-containing protein